MAGIQEGPFQNIIAARPTGEPCFIAFKDGTIGLVDTMGRGLRASRTNNFTIPSSRSATILGMNRSCVVVAASPGQTTPNTLVSFNLGLNQTSIRQYNGSRVELIGPSGSNGFIYRVTGGLQTQNQGVYRASLGPSGISQSYRIREPDFILPGETLEGRDEEFRRAGDNYQPLLGGGVGGMQRVTILSDPVIPEEDGEEPPPWWPPDWPWNGEEQAPERALLYSGGMYQAYSNSGQDRGSRLYQGGMGGILGLGMQNGNTGQVYNYSDYKGALHVGSMANTYGSVLSEGGSYLATVQNPRRLSEGKEVNGREVRAAYYLNTWSFPGWGIGLAPFETSRLDFTWGSAIPRAVVCVRLRPSTLESIQLNAHFEGTAVRNGLASYARDSGGNVILVAPTTVSRPGTFFGSDPATRLTLRRFPSLEVISEQTLRNMDAAGIAYPGGSIGNRITPVSWDDIPPGIIIE